MSTGLKLLYAVGVVFAVVILRRLLPDSYVFHGLVTALFVVLLGPAFGNRPLRQWLVAAVVAGVVIGFGEYLWTALLETPQRDAAASSVLKKVFGWGNIAVLLLAVYWIVRRRTRNTDGGS